MNNSPARIQRILGLSEGISLLVLLGIAMPLKYLMNEPMAVRVVGSLHGILFILYVIHSFIVKDKLAWAYKVLLFALIASVIPFGTIVFERKYLREMT